EILLELLGFGGELLAGGARLGGDALERGFGLGRLALELRPQLALVRRLRLRQLADAALERRDLLARLLRLRREAGERRAVGAILRQRFDALGERVHLLLDALDLVGTGGRARGERLHVGVEFFDARGQRRRVGGEAREPLALLADRALGRFDAVQSRLQSGGIGLLALLLLLELRSDRVDARLQAV